ncbi:MAG: hypothetical protein ABI240_09665 [Sphingomonas sp.]
MTNRTWLSLAALTLVTACNSPVQSNADGSKTIHGANGDITMSVHNAPKNMPVYAPLYANAKIVSSIEGDPKTGAGGFVTFIVQDKPATVMAFYEKTATDNNLSQKMGSPPGADGTQADILSQPGTKRSLTVTVGPTNDGTPGTKVSLSYGEP